MNRIAGDVGGHSAFDALARMRDAAKDFLSTPLWTTSDNELNDLLAGALQFQNQVAAAVLQLVAEADERGLAQRKGAPSTAAWLRHRFNLTPAEAKKQTCLAAALDRDLETTRLALAEGELSPAHAQVVARTIEELPGEVDAEVRESAEAHLVELSARFDAAQLTKLGKRILHVVDPDAADADEARRLAEEEKRAWLRRELTFADDGHGTVWIRGRLPVAEAAPLRRAVDVLASPRPGDAGLPDNRPAAVRNADAVAELGRRALAAGDLPIQGGEVPQLVVTIDWQKLRDQLAAGSLDTGERLTPAAVRRLACDAQILPAALGAEAVPLELGRSMRLFNPAQRRALTIRDKGCAFPDCDRPPSWCEADHVEHWVDGGASDLANGVLLCGFHHRLIHKGDWQVRIAADGRPEFIPPPLIDPRQQPLRNYLRRHS